MGRRGEARRGVFPVSFSSSLHFSSSPSLLLSKSMFDPTLPADHSPNSSVEMRGQLTALKALIDAQQAALAGTARKPDLGALSLALDDPPTSAQVQAVINQLNTLLALLTAP